MYIQYTAKLCCWMYRRSCLPPIEVLYIVYYMSSETLKDFSIPLEVYD